MPWHKCSFSMLNSFTCLWLPLSHKATHSHYFLIQTNKKNKIKHPISFFFFKYIYWLCYYTCPIPPPYSTPSCPPPSLPHLSLFTFILTGIFFLKQHFANPGHSLEGLYYMTPNPGAPPSVAGSSVGSILPCPGLVWHSAQLVMALLVACYWG